MHTRARRLATTAAVGVAIGLLVVVQLQYFQRGIVPGDAFVYLAAGERLNAGHDLYALGVGDRPVDTGGEYWNVPLVSPPPIAVLWRPLAALPESLGVGLWYAAQLMALGSSLLMLLRRVPGLAAAALIVLVLPTAYEIGVGNVNSFLLLGLLVTWRAVVARREPTAGALAAVMTAVKLTPGVLGWWLLATGHRRATIAFVAVGMAAAGLSVLGAGFPAHVQYLEILGDRNAVGVSPLSVGGWARYLGLPSALYELLPAISAVTGLATVWLLRTRLAASYRVAVVTMILGSPAVSINWFVLLYALLAPAAWPVAARPGVEQQLQRGRAKIQPSSSS